MNSWLFSIGTLLLAGFAAAPLAAESVAPPKTFDLDAIDHYVASEVKEKGFVGLSIAIMREGKTVLAKGYGKASLKTGNPVDVDTLFAAGSVTKQFTCAGILMLAEEGKLSVDDKVAKYYPDLTRAKDITLYDLMSHVSGYPDYYPLDFVDRRMEKDIESDKLLKDYAGSKLDFEPRAKWSYSNTGFILLGHIIEKVSGETLGSFYEKRFFTKLGMKHSMFEPAKEKNVALGYTSFALGDPEEAEGEAKGWLHAAGGIFTTPSDLCHWDMALMDGKVLKEKSYKLMTSPRKLSNGRTFDYGCGLSIAKKEGESILQHNGEVSGYLAYNAMIPRSKSAVVLMTNSEYVDAGSLHSLILALLVSADGNASPTPKIDGPPAKEAALEMLHQLQKGDIKRDKLGEDYSYFLNTERTKGAKDRLGPLGEPEKVVVLGTHERGGMEVAIIEFTFKGVKAKGSLYRTPDGKIQQFLLVKS